MTPEQQAAWEGCVIFEQKAREAQKIAEEMRAEYIKTFRTLKDETEVDVQDPDLTGRFFVSDAIVNGRTGEIVYFVSTKNGTTQLFLTAEQLVEVIK